MRHVLSPMRWWQIVQALYLFFHLDISTCDIVCVCVCVCVCVRACLLCVEGGGGKTCVSAFVSARTRAPGCVLTIHQIGTVDAEILSSQRFQAPSLLRNGVHLEDFMHFIILVSQATVSGRGFRCIKGGWGPERVCKMFDHLRVAGKIIININENMLGTHYATKCTRRCM